MRYQRFFITFLFVATGLSRLPFLYADDNATLALHPDRYKAAAEVTGKIHSIDVAANKLSVEDPAGQTVSVSVSTDTRVTDVEDKAMDWKSLKPGFPVIMYYEPRLGTAVQIDVQPNVAGAILGTRRPVSP